MIETKTMETVQTKIDDVLKTHKPEDVLVAFDIDMTLTQPDHPAVYYPALQKYENVFKDILGGLSPEDKDLASTLTTQLFPQRLIKKSTPQMIRNLQHQGVKTMALTSSLAGKIKGFPDKMVILRRDQLQKMGLDFSNSFKNFMAVMEFFDFRKYAGALPTFYHGILSTNGEGDASKGDVLVAFLRHVEPDYGDKIRKRGFHPKVIIFVDDKKKHVESVESKVQAYDPFIQVVGVQYEGAYDYAPLDISKEDFQQFWEDLAKRVKKLDEFKKV